MIIEGKHTEAGQGIFVSDIQAGSAADQAGLLVGDMILAVNEEDLVGADYDAAAGILKRTEGVVRMTVSNPSKATEPARDGVMSTRHTERRDDKPSKSPSCLFIACKVFRFKPISQVCNLHVACIHFCIII